MIGIPQIFNFCGEPKADLDEVASWNALDTGASFTGELKVGLLGYDITCVASVCNQLSDKDGGMAPFGSYCALIDARGLDGLAFSAHWKIPVDATTKHYCAGFRNDSPGDKRGNTMVCTHDDGHIMIVTESFNEFF